MSEANAIIIEFKGIYARVARKLNMSASMVSRVARGERRSPAIEKALKLEIDSLRRRFWSAAQDTKRQALDHFALKSLHMQFRHMVIYYFVEMPIPHAPKNNQAT